MRLWVVMRRTRSKNQPIVGYFTEQQEAKEYVDRMARARQAWVSKRMQWRYENPAPRREDYYVSGDTAPEDFNAWQDDLKAWQKRENSYASSLGDPPSLHYTFHAADLLTLEEIVR